MWTTAELTARTRTFDGFGPDPFAPPGSDRDLLRADGRSKKTLRNGVRRLAEQRPGVYGMLDRDGRLVYVGKSKQLRSRLLSYFTARRGEKAARIVGTAAAVVWEPLPSEFAALLRELQLIRDFRPRWNVRDRPRNAPPAFLCVGRRPAPYAFATRRPPADAIVFGPFGSVSGLAPAADALNDLLGLRDCPQRTRFVFADDKALFEEDLRPGCLRFEVGSCLGPCVGECTRRQYALRVGKLKRFLAGDSDEPLRELTDRMERAAAEKSFEAAARHRDRLAAVTHLATRLARLRDDRRRYHFRYPVTGLDGTTITYAIDGGQVTAVARDDAGPTPLPAAGSHPTVHLVGRWFRARPDELARVTPLPSRRSDRPRPVR